jgi:hypothetical protein
VGGDFISCLCLGGIVYLCILCEMKALIGCEESQAVCIAFRKLGYEAYSCDTQSCSGGHPEWHIIADVLEVIKGGWFTTEAGNMVYIDKWDLLIGFPPCTHMANAGGNWFEQKRKDGRQEEAIRFFYKLFDAPIHRIALENPVGILCGDYIQKHFPHLINDLKRVGLPRSPDQVIQPFYFGDPVRKYTCLWLKNLPKLTHTNEVIPEDTGKFIVRKGAYRNGTLRKLYWYDSISSKGGSKKKSKTFAGIAEAIANQWNMEALKKKTYATQVLLNF